MNELCAQFIFVLLKHFKAANSECKYKIFICTRSNRGAPLVGARILVHGGMDVMMCLKIFCRIVCAFSVIVNQSTEGAAHGPTHTVLHSTQSIRIHFAWLECSERRVWSLLCVLFVVVVVVVGFSSSSYIHAIRCVVPAMVRFRASSHCFDTLNVFCILCAMYVPTYTQSNINVR